MNDWTGNKKTTFATLGASSHSETEREKNDFYATSPVAVHELLKHHEFQKNILEPSCGNGIMSEALKEHGHIVKSSDLIDRGYGDVMDFFSIESASGMDIVTNPPYRYSKQFVEHAVSASLFIRATPIGVSNPTGMVIEASVLRLVND